MLKQFLLLNKMSVGLHFPHAHQEGPHFPHAHQGLHFPHAHQGLHFQHAHEEGLQNSVLLHDLCCSKHLSSMCFLAVQMEAVAQKLIYL